MSAENELLMIVKDYGFSIAISLYLLYERTKTFKEQREDAKAEKLRLEALTNTVLEVVKSNTASNTGLTATIQKLCEMMNHKET